MPEVPGSIPRSNARTLGITLIHVYLYLKGLYRAQKMVFVVLVAGLVILHKLLLFGRIRGKGSLAWWAGSCMSVRISKPAQDRSSP